MALAVAAGVASAAAAAAAACAAARTQRRAAAAVARQQLERQRAEEAAAREACPGCGMRLPSLRRHMKRCCPEYLPEQSEGPLSEEREQARREACGEHSWISLEEVHAGALQSVEAIEDPLLRQVLHLRFGLDRGAAEAAAGEAASRRRTPAEVADALGGKFAGKPQTALTLIRQALRSIPLTADDPKDVQVIYEDAELLAVAKPPFLRSTPVHRFVGKSLTSQLVGYLRQRRAEEGRPPGVAEAPLLLHRLDQSTSGVVLCAKTKAAASFMQDCWHGPRCQKEYLALAVRTPDAKLAAVGESLVVRAPIGKDVDSSDPVRRAVNREDGQSAATRLEVLAASSKCGTAPRVLLLSCKLEENGRTHQIRIHAAHAGLPLLGDQMYGGPAVDLSANQGEQVHDGVIAPGRVALHAWRLRVPHPQTGSELLLEAPLPADLQLCMTSCALTWPVAAEGAAIDGAGYAEVPEG